MDLVTSVSKEVSIPVIASGGYGKLNDVNKILDTGCDAFAIAGCFHYSLVTVDKIKEQVRKCGFSAAFT